jgi:hypothetical protein
VRWSELTAVKAALMPASLDKNFEGLRALERLRASWDTQPICTSIVVMFWQRYLCKLAPYLKYADSPDAVKGALDLIHRWMPIQADRALPGDLLRVLNGTGWIKCLQPSPMSVSL